MKKIITFAAPRIKRYETDEFKPSGESRFVAISLNGPVCKLLCDHCKTRMLQALYHSDDPDKFAKLCDRLGERGCEGMLITGGCDSDGTIPLPRFASAVRVAKEKYGLKIATHTKLIHERFADACVEAKVDLVMCDLVGDSKPLREIYHLDGFGTQDVEKSIQIAVARNLRLAPHIMIGIDRGNVGSEFKALDMLDGVDFEVLALVVLTPLRNTPMAKCEVDVKGVLSVMEKAREKFPGRKITLGCAKMWGENQRMFEEKALEIGLDAIAYPSEGIVTRARNLGYDVRFIETCCAFL